MTDMADAMFFYKYLKKIYFLYISIKLDLPNINKKK